MILGGTIRELQSRMTMKEVSIWLSYRAKYGPPNDVRRYDRPAALAAYMANRVAGGKAEMIDFMPFGKDEKQAEIGDIIEAFGGIKVGKPR